MQAQSRIFVLDLWRVSPRLHPLHARAAQRERSGHRFELQEFFSRARHEDNEFQKLRPCR